jgi:hypothetical protein
LYNAKFARLQEMTHIGRSRQSPRELEPDLERDFADLVTSKGYRVEEHCVETKDGEWTIATVNMFTLS